MTALRKWMDREWLGQPRWLWLLAALCLVGAMLLLGWAGAIAAAPFALWARLRGRSAPSVSLPDPLDVARADAVRLSEQAEERVRAMDRELQDAETRARTAMTEAERMSADETVRAINQRRQRER